MRYTIDFDALLMMETVVSAPAYALPMHSNLWRLKNHMVKIQDRYQSWTRGVQ